MNTQNKIYFYRIECTFKFQGATLDRNVLIRARDMSDAYEQFLDNNFITKKDVLHYKVTFDGDLQELGFNPYHFGKCNWSCFKVIKEMSLSDTIKISAIKYKTIPRIYNEKTIGESLRRLEHDGYIKCESINAIGEKIYIKKGQVKNEN